MQNQQEHTTQTSNVKKETSPGIIDNLINSMGGDIFKSLAAERNKALRDRVESVRKAIVGDSDDEDSDWE